MIYEGTFLDERSEKQRALDAWLPITSSRNGNWWNATALHINAIVGVGALSLPYAMKHLGWDAGVAVLVLSWIITLFTLLQMIQMHECEPGERFDCYHELGQHVFGKKLGLWIVLPQQIIIQVGVGIVYMIVGGNSMMKIYKLVVCGEGCSYLEATYFIMMFGVVQLVLTQCPNLDSISFMSLTAAVMSICYCVIASAASAFQGVKPYVSYHQYRSAQNFPFYFLTALGEVSFAYAAHSVVLEIQATLPSTPENSSKERMSRSAVVGYIIIALCHFPVAVIGYYVFGDTVGENILVSLQKPNWLIALANMFVVFHVVGSYQVYTMPVFDMMETFLVRHLEYPPGPALRLISRSIYVACSMFVAIMFPHFGSFIGFLGGFAFAPCTYILPCIMWLSIFKPKKFSLSWTANWICIILGVMLMVLAH